MKLKNKFIALSVITSLFSFGSPAFADHHEMKPDKKMADMMKVHVESTMELMNTGAKMIKEGSSSNDVEKMMSGAKMLKTAMDMSGHNMMKNHMAPPPPMKKMMEMHHKMDAHEHHKHDMAHKHDMKNHHHHDKNIACKDCDECKTNVKSADCKDCKSPKTMCKDCQKGVMKTDCKTCAKKPVKKEVKIEKKIEIKHPHMMEMTGVAKEMHDKMKGILSESANTLVMSGSKIIKEGSAAQDYKKMMDGAELSKIGMMMNHMGMMMNHPKMEEKVEVKIEKK
jgi:hypothetical protein